MKTRKNCNPNNLSKNCVKLHPTKLFGDISNNKISMSTKNEEGIGAFFAALIEDKENIPIIDGVNDNDELIIYTANYPWAELTAEEKVLTKEKLIDIFYKFLDRKPKILIME